MIRFSFDLGTNSIGWAVYELDVQSGKPKKLAKLGVRIFSDGRDPQNKESNAKGRREPRSHRRQQDRRLKRRTRLLDELETHGLMPPAGPERNALFPAKVGKKKRDRKKQKHSGGRQKRARISIALNKWPQGQQSDDSADVPQGYTNPADISSLAIIIDY